MQTESTRWDIFARTGKIDDYLAYRRECAQHAVADDKQTGDIHATNDQRHHPAPPPHPRG